MTIFAYTEENEIQKRVQYLLKFLDRNAYNKGLIPELKYVIKKVSGVKSVLKLLEPLYL